MSQKVERIVFAAPYSLIDYSSGAAVATNDCLQLLAGAGFRCQAYCPTRLDFNEEVCFEQTLSELGLEYRVENAAVGSQRMKIVFTRLGKVPVTLFRNQFTRTGPWSDEIPAFLAGYERFLDTNRPHAVLT